jgi:hypothetical protein
MSELRGGSEQGGAFSTLCGLRQLPSVFLLASRIEYAPSPSIFCSGTCCQILWLLMRSVSVVNAIMATGLAVDYSVYIAGA